MWEMIVPRSSQWLYLGLMFLAVLLGVLAVAFADDASQSFLSGAVTLALAAILWRGIAVRRGMVGADIPMIGEAEGVSAPEIAVMAVPTREPVVTVERGRVESWDDDAGWGVLSAGLPLGGVFAHFSVVEAEGHRSLTPGDAVAFDYMPAAAPGAQDGCSYVAERVVRLED